MFDILATYPTEQLIAFMIGGLVLNLTPGSDVLFATASGIQGGPRAGAAAGLGVGLGGIVHVTLAALGLSALVAAHPGALGVIRWAGATYLLWIAVKSWRAGAPHMVAARGPIGPAEALRRGVTINVLNPKVMLFMLAFLPQFTRPEYGPVWQQIVLLGSIVTITGTLTTIGYGLTAGWLGARLARRMGVLNRVAAVLFGGLAARLVID
ncbi:LysE family translocator [Paenirhodobacter sp. CAU 1674]|uniref:LysE family translocator n=1 Tax=Paenirhodobacter sp. CAU 1674 TaxID=3032596 RepID=UPI0023D985D4|nr:LysE family translocator [Paenirhodobacter sp. CAU 1674]MDF2141147.1 LysE family translocator [Paenirhodobacter sp. CAU 1674]